jgi:flagellar biosynthesis protein FliQ
MQSDQAVALLDRMLWASMIVALPILIVTLAVGLIVSVFQATTQLQEMTLSYVPKLLAAGAVLILLGPWMISQITVFATSMIRLIPTIH